MVFQNLGNIWKLLEIFGSLPSCIKIQRRQISRGLQRFPTGNSWNLLEAAGKWEIQPYGITEVLVCSTATVITCILNAYSDSSRFARHSALMYTDLTDA